MNDNINLLNIEDLERLKEIVDVIKRLKTLSLSLRRYYREIISHCAEDVTEKDVFIILEQHIMPHFSMRNDYSKMFIRPQYVATILNLKNRNIISSNSFKRIIDVMMVTGEEPEKIIVQQNLILKNDNEEIINAIKKVLNDNIDQVEQYKSGKYKILGFLVGKVMKEIKTANPKVVNELLLSELMK